MKRWIAMATFVCLLMTMMPLAATAAQPVTVYAGGINSSRGAGELMIYTDEYGDSTGTNQWGMEAIIGADDRVISLARGNSEIPEGGLVLSGHDDEENPDGLRMKTWIMSNIRVGQYVYVDPHTLLITVSDTPIDNAVPVFYDVDEVVSGVNTTRGEDEIVVYTPAFGATTGTNAYGYEIVVDNGAVIKRGGNSNRIPENGFVVSGHSKMARWLKYVVVDGMRAEFDEATKTVLFVYDAKSIETSVETLLTQTAQALEEAKKAFVYLDYEAAENQLDAAKASYDTALQAFQGSGDEEAFAKATDAILAQTRTLKNSFCESYPVQYRGVWVRPSQTSAEQVMDFIGELHEAGINTVSVEGWFENGVIMEVPEDSLFKKHPRFSFDVLQAYIDACEFYHMECHLWMPIMNVGSSVDSGFDGTVLSEHPEWLSLDNTGSPDNESGFMMVDPANEEARDYLVDFYRYLVTTYDIDCFEMDYIRYYAVGEKDFGYTEAAFEGFEEAYGYGVTPEFHTTAPYWNDWCQYRRDCITEMVKAIRAMMDEAAPDVLLAADTVATPDDARNRNYQDFPRWLEEGLIDMLHPMAYGDGFAEDIRNMVKLGGEHTMVATGLGVYMDTLGAYEMERQAREDNDAGTCGDFYFEANTYLSDKVFDTLSKTVYRREAIPPFADVQTSVAMWLVHMQERVDNVLLPLGGVDDAQATALSEAIGEVKAYTQNGVMDETALAALREAIAAVENEKARATLENDLAQALHIQTVITATREAPATAQGLGGMIWWIVGAAVIVIVAAVIVAVVCRKRKTTNGKEETA